MIIDYILEVIGRIFVEIVLNGLIVGAWKLIKRTWNFLKYKVCGLQRIERKLNPIKELEKKMKNATQKVMPRAIEARDPHPSDDRLPSLSTTGLYFKDRDIESSM